VLTTNLAVGHDGIKRQGVPSPGGQVSGMVGKGAQPADEVGATGAIPTTSSRATRPQHGGKPGMIGVGISGSCPRAAVWSGYARSTGWHLGRSVGTEQIRSEPPSSLRHHPAPDDTNAPAQAA